MSKTTIILSVVALFALLGLGLLARANLTDLKSVNSQVNIAARSKDPEGDESFAKDSSNSQPSTNSSIDKVYNSLVGDEAQEKADFDSESSDKNQIKDDSSDVLNLSQSYNENDF